MDTGLPQSDPRYAVTGSNYSLNGKQKALLALAEELGPRFAERAERHDRDGWFHSGDLARVDEEGYFWIVGRSKDVIISGAKTSTPPSSRT
jgi:acyl-CoA synthetase (AMP-forming)/AMP-acid ligase II